MTFMGASAAAVAATYLDEALEPRESLLNTAVEWASFEAETQPEE